MTSALLYVTGEIIINRPIAEVFDFVADERNETRQPTDGSGRTDLERPDRRGTRFHTELKTAGRTKPMTVEFTRLDRPQLLASTTRSSMMETEAALTFDPVPGGTRMRWAWDVRPRGLLKLITPLVGPLGRRQEQAIGSELKHLLESEAGSPH